MNCFSELTYSIYADGELAETDVREVEIHLATCAHCRQLVAALRAENRLLSTALKEVEDLAPALPARPAGLLAVVTKALPLAGAAVLLSLCLQVLGEYSSAAIDWLNPARLAGGLNLLFTAAYYVVDQGAAMLSSVLAFATVLVAAAIVGSAIMAASRGGMRLLRPGAGLLALLLLAVPGFGLEKRSSKTTITVPASETIDDSLLVSGDTVRVDGTVNGDVLAFGRRIEVRGNIKGDLIAMGQRLDVSGTVDGNIYTFTQGSTLSGNVGRNVYGWMQSFSLATAARVGGGLVVGGADVNLDGNVNRSVTAFAGAADVRGEVGRDLEFAGGTLSLAPPARVGGDLTARVKKTSDVRVDSGVVVSGKTNIGLTVRKSRFSQPKFYFWQAVSFAGALLVGWLMLVFMPGFLHGAVQTIRSGWRSLGLGFAVFVATPIAVIILALTMVGLPVALIGLGLYAAGLYLAKILVGVFIGRALDKTPHTTTARTFLALLVGLLIIYVTIQIPYGIGALAHLAVFCFGLGAFAWRLYRTYRPLPA